MCIVEFGNSSIEYLLTMIANVNLLMECTVMLMLKTIAKVELHIIDHVLPF